MSERTIIEEMKQHIMAQQKVVKDSELVAAGWTEAEVEKYALAAHTAAKEEADYV